MMANNRRSVRRDFRMPTHEELLKAYTEVIASFPENVRLSMIELNYHRYLILLKTIIPCLYQGSFTNILDLGIGPGIVPLVLRKFGYNVIGVDTWAEYLPDYNNVSGTQENILERLKTGNINTIYSDLEKEGLPFRDKSVDVILFFDVIEHLPIPPKMVLEEIKRILKLKGVLVLSTPNVTNLKNRITFLLGKSINPRLDTFTAWFIDGDSYYFSHRREYSFNEILVMCKSVGLLVEHIEFSNCLQIPTRVKGTDYYTRDFKLNSMNQVLMAFYLAFMQFFKTLRYYAIYIVNNDARDGK